MTKQSHTPHTHYPGNGMPITLEAHGEPIGVGSVWYERARPGRKIKVLDVGWRYGRYVISVQTITVANERMASYPSNHQLRNFKKYFKPVTRHMWRLHPDTGYSYTYYIFGCKSEQPEHLDCPMRYRISRGDFWGSALPFPFLANPNPLEPM